MAEAGGLKKRVVIINKFGARHSSITGKSAIELADFLSGKGVEVHIVSIRTQYKGLSSDIKELHNYSVTELKSFYNGDKKYLRLIFSLIDGFRLITKSMCLKKHEVKIVMTDPPLLNALAIFLSPFYKSKLMFWTMDLYPDAFLSTGLVSSKNIIYQILSRFVYRNPPDYLLCLGHQQLSYLTLKYMNINIRHTILPCGLIKPMDNFQDIPNWKVANNDKILFCYAGNIGEAHSAEFLISLIDILNPVKYKIILSLYGSKTVEVLNNIKNKEAVIKVDFLVPEHLKYIDINVASLLPKWNNVCVPSKVVSAICAGTPVLYNATENSEGYQMFSEAIWLISKFDDFSSELKIFLEKLTHEEILRKKIITKKYAENLLEMEKEALNQILNFVNQI